MKRNLVLFIITVVSMITLGQCKDGTLETTYSGTYCIYDHDYVMDINQSGPFVSFTLTVDTQVIEGLGTVSGTSMTLQAEVNSQTMTIDLFFADDADSFTGEYSLQGLTNPLNGTRGDCPDTYPVGDIELTAPYVDFDDMDSIHKGFGCVITSAWEDHSGLDIVPTTDLVPFRAMASGKVVELNSIRHSGDNNWITSVEIKYNSTYRVLYAFENLTPDEADRDIQLANLDVAIGRMVSQGDIIGRLHIVSDTYYHVHISLIKNGERICPEPYLTEEARTGLTELIQTINPDLEMCEGCE